MRQETLTSTENQTLVETQSGFAAILITFVMMIVLSLIVLGFAQISRREQRQSLDRQLSTQAFYAAETAVNDATTFLRSNPGLTTAKTDCQTPGVIAPYSTGLTANPVLDAASGVAYTCLLINPAPTSQQYDNIGGNSQLIAINAASNIDHITLTWQAAAQPANNACPAAGTFPPVSGWNCNFGIARMDLVSTAAPFSRSTLSTTTMSAFFAPSTAGGSGTTGFNSNGGANYGLYPADCTSGSFCTETITGLGGTQYEMRIRFIYQKTAFLSVSAFGSPGSTNPLGITGSQVEIDATGKASDVLRRIKVRVSNSIPPNVPDFAVQTKDSICKYFSLSGSGIAPTLHNLTDPSCSPS